MRYASMTATTLAPIEDVTTGSGAQYRVYSSFWKALSQRMPPDAPLPAPQAIPRARPLAQERHAGRLGLAADQARLVGGGSPTGRRANTTRGWRSIASPR